MVKPFRKLFRLAGLLFPALYSWTTKETTLAFAVVLLILFLGLEGLRSRRATVNDVIFRKGSIILRESERTGLTSITWFLIGVPVAVLLFPREVAVGAWLFFLVGDAAAEFVGTRWGRTRVLGKTLEGSLACLLTCLSLGLVIWAWLGMALPAVVAGAVTATLVEFLPLRLNDNFTVPLATGLVMLPFAGSSV